MATTSFSDFGNEGIPVVIKTGVIYPDGQPYTVKGFKKLVLMFVPQGSTSFDVDITIDNQDAQTITFSQTGEFDALGDTLILKQSKLGVNPVLAPVTLPIDGYGHGVILEITTPLPDIGKFA